MQEDGNFGETTEACSRLKKRRQCKGLDEAKIIVCRNCHYRGEKIRLRGRKWGSDSQRMGRSADKRRGFPEPIRERGAGRRKMFCSR